MEVPTIELPAIDATTYDELYELAQELDIHGRGDMVKAELYDAIEEHTYDEWDEVHEVDEGDKVQMNHLASTLTVREVLDNSVVMVTPRGGKHKLVINGDDAHLERWRSDTNEWMNNSDDPTEFEVVEKSDA